MDIEEEAARAEITRLAAAGPGLAVEIMKAWQAVPGRPLAQPEVAAWLLRDFPAGQRLLPLLRSAVRRGCELLTEEGLLEERRATSYVVGPDGAAGSGPAGLAPTLRGERLLAERELDWWAAQYVRRHLHQITEPPSGHASDARYGSGMPLGEPDRSWTPGCSDPIEVLRDAEFEQRRSGYRPDSRSRGSRIRDLEPDGPDGMPG